ncbi:MAG: dihydroxyacetone kinase phosphoryl donor subunit DhaM [Caldilineaceae bacterium]
MVGLVLVSHSQTLAAGVMELIHQMAPLAAVAVAAGTENPDEPIGTDPQRVYAAIEAVYHDDGVLVLMDLGSAIMSAEAAIEFLEPAQQEQVYLCEAPLAEGGLAAAVAASGGASLARVMHEARAALPGKTSQLEPILRIKPEQRGTAGTPISAVTADAELILTIPNRLGLHARPAARLVELIHRFDAVATLTKAARTIDPASITQVLTLGVRQVIPLPRGGRPEVRNCWPRFNCLPPQVGDGPDAPLPMVEPVAHTAAGSDGLFGGVTGVAGYC